MGEDMLARGEPGNLVARVRTHRQAVHAFIDAVAAERAAAMARMEGLHRLRLATIDLAGRLRRAIHREYPRAKGDPPAPVSDLLEWIARLEAMARRATTEAADLAAAGAALDERLASSLFANLFMEVPPMTVTETLKHEHRVIELVLGAIDREARKAAHGEPIDPGFFAQAIDFIRNFADKCHHGKEEGILFKAMAEKGVPVEGGPIGVMLGDHEEGRRFIRAAREALDRNDLRAVADSLTRYTALLRQHIMKEDNVLYPMAERVLSEAELDDLAERFEAVEREEMGEGTHERYHGLAHSLAGEPARR